MKGTEAVKTVALELQPCCGKRSGVGIYTYELARRLRDSGDLRFCGNLFNFLGRNDTREALRGIEIPLNVNRFFPYIAYRGLCSLLPIPYKYFFPIRADLSVFFNYIVPPQIQGKVIATIYDMTYRRFPETMHPRNLRRLNGGLLSSVRRSARVMTISEFSKREIMELLDVPEEKISVVPCAPSFTEKAASEEELSVQYGVKKPYILYVGNVEPRKNLPRLLRAYEVLKKQHHIRHQLVIAGWRSWKTREFDSALANLSVKDDVILTGYIPDPVKNALYQNADVFVFPSLYEGFGIPPLEAMRWGCPVVASCAASLPEVVGDAAVLVNPLDEMEIAKGLFRVLEDREYANELIRRGYERERQFTWDASVRKFMSVCREVLGMG